VLYLDQEFISKADRILGRGIADAFATFIDRYGRFFRTKTRDCAAVAGRYLLSARSGASGRLHLCGDGDRG
jgi:hypothetical protein